MRPWPAALLVGSGWLLVGALLCFEVGRRLRFQAGRQLPRDRLAARAQAEADMAATASRSSTCWPPRSPATRKYASHTPLVASSAPPGMSSRGGRFTRDGRARGRSRNSERTRGVRRDRHAPRPRRDQSPPAAPAVTPANSPLRTSRVSAFAPAAFPPHDGRGARLVTEEGHRVPRAGLAAAELLRRPFVGAAFLERLLRRLLGELLRLLRTLGHQCEA